MIARVWRGWATPANADAYETHFRTTVLPHLEAVPGYGGAQLLRREADAEVELMVISTFASLGAVRAFAGDAYESAVVEPEAQRVLTRFDERVALYEVRFGDNPRIGKSRGRAIRRRDFAT